MEPMKNTFEIVSMFVDRINAHDADGLYALMEEDHVFIDALGRCVKGREAMRTAWQAYFAMVPDYWIKVDRMLQQETVVAIFGKAGGTVADDGRLDAANRWEVPAAWQAIAGESGVAAWQVFADNEPIRQIISRLARK